MPFHESYLWKTPGKESLSSPYLTVSLSNLMHLLLVPNSAQHIGVYFIQGVLKLKDWTSKDQTSKGRTSNDWTSKRTELPMTKPRKWPNLEWPNLEKDRTSNDQTSKVTKPCKTEPRKCIKIFNFNTFNVCW